LRGERKELGKHQNDASDSSKPFIHNIIRDDGFLSMCDCCITVTDIHDGRKTDCLSPFLATKMSKYYEILV